MNYPASNLALLDAFERAVRSATACDITNAIAEADDFDIEVMSSNYPGPDAYRSELLVRMQHGTALTQYEADKLAQLIRSLHPILTDSPFWDALCTKIENIRNTNGVTP